MISVFLKWSVRISLFLILLVFLLTFLLPFFIKPAFLERLVIATVEKHTDFLLTLEHPRFSVLPLPTFQFDNVKVRNKKEVSTNPPFLNVQHVKCELHLLPLLLKRVEFAKVNFSGMDLKWSFANQERSWLNDTVQLKDTNLTIENIRSNHWMKFAAAGKWLSDEPNMFAHGKAKANFNPWQLAHTALTAEVVLEKLSVAEFLKRAGFPSAAAQVDQGVFKVTTQISKGEGSSQASAKSKLVLDQLVYHSAADKTVKSKPAPYGLDLEAALDLDAQVLSFKNVGFSSPFMNVTGKGAIDLQNQKLESVRLSSDSIILDDLPRYLLPLTYLLPFNLGFSGEGQVSLQLQGAWDQLKVDGKVDMTKALLTYSRYFVKPKLVPLIVTTDELMVRRGKEFDGGINIRFQEAKMKGALVKFDVASRVGEVTFVTNLIPLKGWQEFLPTFAGYEFSGNAKFFANGKGDFERLGTMLVMYHVAFDQVSARAGTESNPPLFQNLSGSIDVDPLDLETKDFQFDFGTNHFEIQLKMFLRQGLQLILQVKSPELDIRNFVLQLQKAFAVLGFPANSFDWKGLEKTLGQWIQSGTKVENFSAKFNYEKNRLILEHFDGDVYGGHISLSGSLDSLFLPSQKSVDTTAAQKPSVDQELAYQFKTELQNVSLARMLRRDVSKPVEGNLFLVFQGAGRGFAKEALETQLAGEGTLSITNGEFRTFDILGSLGGIAELTGLSRFVSGTTRFSDVSGDFRLANGKIQTDHILVYSSDFDIDTSGEMDLGGNLNFRLDTVLSKELSRKVNRHLTKGDRLGPIPLLLTGKIDSPTLRPDPSLIQDFLRNLVAQQLKKVVADRDWFKNLQPKTEKQIPPEKKVTSQETSSQSEETSDQDAVTTGMTLLEALFQKRE